MESRKRARPTNNNNNNNAKRFRICATFQPEDLCDLGVDVLSDDDDDDDTGPVIYNDDDIKTAEKFEETRRVKPLAEATWTYRRKSADERAKVNPFDGLPDELVLSVVRYLDKKSLVALALTCHRFDRLCHDDAFWSRLNLTSRKLEVDNIGHILGVGVKVLRLNSVIFPSPILSPEMSLKMENFVAKVKYLDMSYVWIKVEDLTLLLKKMRCLCKLSLEGACVDDAVVREIVANKDLDTLNLAMVTGLNHVCVFLVAKHLRKLESLNLAWTGLQNCSYHSLCSELTPRIKHLDLSGSHLSLRNTDLNTLFTRCTALESLDISDCLHMSPGSLRELMKNLPDLKFLGISRCYQLDLMTLTELAAAPKLETLAAYRLIKDVYMEEIRDAMPSVRINKNPLSVIARPTVGIRRTSIWEQQTSD